MFHATYLRAFLLVLFSTVAWCSATEAATPKDEAAATAAKGAGGVDGSEVIISLGDAKLTLEQINWMQPDASDSQLAWLARRWLENQLMYAEAEKRGITKQPEPRFIAEMMRKNTFAQALRAEVQDAVKVTEKDVLAHYEQNKFADPRLSRPGYLTFSHVRTKTLDEANSALTRLKRGENINDLARRVSISDDATRGGVARRQMYRRVERNFGKKFLDAVTAAKEGELIGPVKMEDGGYEIVLKMDEVKPVPRPLEDVKDSIRARLERDERDKAYKSLLDSLEQAAADRIVKSPRLTEAEKARSEIPRGSGSPPASVKPAPARRARQKSN